MADVTNDEIRKRISLGKAYTLVLLYRGASRERPEEEAAALQEAHLRYLFGLERRGLLLVNGPLVHDGDLRGISIYAAEDVEEGRALAEADPAVRAGHLRVEAYPWFGIPGSELK